MSNAKCLCIANQIIGPTDKLNVLDDLFNLKTKKNIPFGDISLTGRIVSEKVVFYEQMKRSF